MALNTKLTMTATSLRVSGLISIPEGRLGSLSLVLAAPRFPAAILVPPAACLLPDAVLFPDPALLPDAVLLSVFALPPDALVLLEDCPIPEAADALLPDDTLLEDGARPIPAALLEE